MLITSPPARNWVRFAKTASKSRIGAGIENMKLHAEGLRGRQKLACLCLSARAGSDGLTNKPMMR